MSALRSVEFSPYPRLTHIERHVFADGTKACGYRKTSLALRLRVLPELLTDDTQAEIAARLGCGPRLVYYHLLRIREAMGLTGHELLVRLTLLRIAAGFDPCWCES